jgi:hypothetical protein
MGIRIDLQELKNILKNNPSIKINRHDLKTFGEFKNNKSKYNVDNSELGKLARTVDGILFDSKDEAVRYCELVLLKTAGHIKKFGLQPSFELDAGMKYTADFWVEYFDKHIEYEECKGVWTEAAKIRVKLFKQKYPDKILKIIHKGVAKDA